MKIALLGYGKMGRYIEKLAVEAGDEIVLRIDENNRGDLQSDDLKVADVAIDFSRPDAATANIRLCLAAGIPVVTGTTGWLHELPTIKEEVARAEGALFWASNFSIGVNVFFAAARDLSRRLKDAAYVVSISETHHTEKLDAPSGTAITLAEGVEEELRQKVDIQSFREPDVPGTHLLRFSSDIDTIELTHTAHSREGFARGALTAAGWVQGRKGVFTMTDLLAAE